MKKVVCIILVVVVLLIIAFLIWDNTGKTEITNEGMRYKLIEDMKLKVALNVQNYKDANSFNDNEIVELLFYAQYRNTKQDEEGYMLSDFGFVKNDGSYPAEMVYIAKPEEIKAMAKELFHVKENSSIWEEVNKVSLTTAYDKERNVYYTVPTGGTIADYNLTSSKITVKNNIYDVMITCDEIDSYSASVIGTYDVKIKLQYNESNQYFKYTILSLEKTRR